MGNFNLHEQLSKIQKTSDDIEDLNETSRLNFMELNKMLCLRENSHASEIHIHKLSTCQATKQFSINTDIFHTNSDQNTIKVEINNKKHF